MSCSELSILVKDFLIVKYINYGIVQNSVIKNIIIENGIDINNNAFDFKDKQEFFAI